MRELSDDEVDAALACIPRDRMSMHVNAAELDKANERRIYRAAYGTGYRAGRVTGYREGKEDAAEHAAADERLRANERAR